jgi:hypothetical protein
MTRRSAGEEVPARFKAERGEVLGGDRATRPVLGDVPSADLDALPPGREREVASIGLLKTRRTSLAHRLAERAQ